MLSKHFMLVHMHFWREISHPKSYSTTHASCCIMWSLLCFQKIPITPIYFDPPPFIKIFKIFLPPCLSDPPFIWHLRVSTVFRPKYLTMPINLVPNFRPYLIFFWTGLQLPFICHNSRYTCKAIWTITGNSVNNEIKELWPDESAVCVFLKIALWCQTILLCPQHR